MLRGPLQICLFFSTRQPGISTAEPSLEAIRRARGDVEKITRLLKGNVQTCYKLFEKAVKESDPVSQIQLSYALFKIEQGNDASKKISSLGARNLEKFPRYPGGFVLFNSAYDQAMGVESDWITRRARAKETFRAAANLGYLPAFLELKCKEWEPYRNNYGLAVQLRPFVGKGDRQLDYHFGQALKNGSQIGSELYYEGLYWMSQSCSITVECPRENESFEDFTRRYQSEDVNQSPFYDFDGFRYVEPRNSKDFVVLAPSKKSWDAFVKEKLGNVRFSPEESYLFRYDAAKILALLNQYKIEATWTSSFVESATEGSDFETCRGGKTVHGFWINSFVLYQGNEKIGQISVKRATFEIYEAFKKEEIQPIIDFIENVMKRTGSAGSAYDWLRQMAVLNNSFDD